MNNGEIMKIWRVTKIHVSHKIQHLEWKHYIWFVSVYCEILHTLAELHCWSWTGGRVVVVVVVELLSIQPKVEIFHTTQIFISNPRKSHFS